MTLTRVLTTSSVLALLAGPALADLTAEDVLADQLAQIALYGLDAQANGQSRSGDVLTVESLTATASIPEEDASVELTIGGAMFTEQGDGSVIITYPNEIPISVTVSIPRVSRSPRCSTISVAQSSTTASRFCRARRPQRATSRTVAGNAMPCTPRQRDWPRGSRATAPIQGNLPCLWRSVTRS